MTDETVQEAKNMILPETGENFGMHKKHWKLNLYLISEVFWMFQSSYQADLRRVW